MRTPRSLVSADFSRVQAVFSDVDGTLTSGHHIESSTFHALESLAEAGVKVVLVSGRPAGFGECWARTLPVAGVIVENGGLHFVRDAKGRLKKVYAVASETRRKAQRTTLVRAVKDAIRRVRGARLSTDSVYTEVDLAIDYNEEVKLGHQGADALESFLRARGVRAVRSSVHVNCWMGNFDKLTATRRFVEREWGMSLKSTDSRFVYVGDSFNDAPMFGAFSLSVGVANVMDVVDRIEHMPAFVTASREGRGFRELAEHVKAQVNT